MSRQAELLIQQAKSNLANNDTHLALDLLQKAKSLSKNDPALTAVIYLEMAGTCARSKRIESTLSFFKKALDLDPSVRIQASELVKDVHKSGQKKLAKELQKILPDRMAVSEDSQPLDKQNSDRSFTNKKNKVSHLSGAVLNNLNLNKILRYTAASVILLLVVSLVWFGIQKIPSLGRDKPLDIARIQDNVGQVIILCKFFDSDLESEITMPVSFGSSFSISTDGYLLTNRHVIDLISKNRQKDGIMETQLIVCYGPRPSDRYAAKIIHEFPYVDAALLKIKRHFKAPFSKISKDFSPGTKVIACGFPGKAQDLITSLDSKSINSKFSEELYKLRKKGNADFFKLLPEESFTVSVTSGIISSIRHIDNIKWIQTDATVNQGNSGGPLITPDYDLVAMNTLGHTDSETTNLSLLISQLKDELKPWVILK